MVQETKLTLANHSGICLGHRHLRCRTQRQALVHCQLKQGSARLPKGGAICSVATALSSGFPCRRHNINGDRAVDAILARPDLTEGQASCIRSVASAHNYSDVVRSETFQDILDNPEVTKRLIYDLMYEDGSVDSWFVGTGNASKRPPNWPISHWTGKGTTEKFMKALNTP